MKSWRLGTLFEACTRGHFEIIAAKYDLGLPFANLRVSHPFSVQEMKEGCNCRKRSLKGE